MGTFLSYSKTTENKFTISYPQHGLFRTADVRIIEEGEDPVYECRLINGSVLSLKKSASSRQWVEAATEVKTIMTSLIGGYIDEFLGKRK